MRKSDKTEARVSERIAIRMITLAASKGVMLPKGDAEIQARFEEYSDLMPKSNKGECSKWVAAEVYAFLRGFQLSGKYGEENLKNLISEDNILRSLKEEAA